MIDESTIKKIRIYLLRVGFVLAGLLFSYIMIYKFSYLPNGYEVISQQKNSLLIQSYNPIGAEEKEIQYAPPADEEWKMDYLIDQIQDQKESLLLWFTTIFLYVSYLVSETLKRKPLWKVVIGRGSLLGIFIAFIPVARELEKINSFF
ncbi:hypothetical protein [Halobacillus naozhouensis]|uniref:Uncharacterized protein n=1 Tax=Halobacillus naozhouensis TaxID=554880 RepID=A0ABY8J012_9BACI|nr:hypothetical protein [Halobacillus naozhouensis]WFT74321.1 hypothetical protein P9989_18475 [Halobacillus naozhouensis]